MFDEVEEVSIHRKIQDVNLRKVLALFSLMALLLLSQIQPMFTPGAAQSSSRTKLISSPLLAEEISYLEAFESRIIGGHSSRVSGSLYEALPHAFHALTILLEHERTSNLAPEYLLEARNVMSFAVRYFIDPYFTDRRGFVSFYSEELGDDSYPRSPRKAVDQIAMAVSLQALLDVLPITDEDHSDYEKLLEGTISFMQDYFLDEEYFGWYREAIPLSKTHYTIDESKLAKDQLLIAWLYQLSPSKFKQQVGSEFQEHVLRMLDTFLINWTNPQGGLKYAGDVAGKNLLSVYSADVNSLWGLVLLKAYATTKNDSYLQGATKVFNFLWHRFWDVGVGGLFSRVDDELNIASRGKDLVGNGLFTLLSHELLTVYPQNNTYRNMFVKNFRRWSQWFITTLPSGVITRSAVVNRQGIPSSSPTYTDNVFATFIRMQLPHILEIHHPTKQFLGLPIKLEFLVHRGNPSPLTLQIEAPSLTDEIINATIGDGEDIISVSLSPRTNARIGNHEITIRLLFDSLVLDETVIFVEIGGNTVIPNSFLLLLGTGIFVALVVLLRSPPAFLVEWERWMQSEAVGSGDVSDSSSQNEVHPSEDKTGQLERTNDDEMKS